MATNTFFDIATPNGDTTPFVFNSPHSGRDYPLDFIASSRLDSRTLRRSEDFMIDQLFSAVIRHGAPFLSARFPRAWLDVNREPYELDPAMFSGTLPPYANTRSARVTSGLGTIARIVAENEEIYSGPIPADHAIKRVESVYKPYHAALRNLLANAVADHGFAILIDCHSMPSSLAQHRGQFRGQLKGLPTFNRGEAMRADFVLGDRFGSSCNAFLTHHAAEILRALGYRVAINKPYAGGFITEHYGRPTNGLHSLQVEVNRALYMDEGSIETHRGFDRLRADMDRFSALLIERCLESRRSFLASIPLAAE